MKGILGVSDEPLVSCDYKMTNVSSTIDSSLTMVGCCGASLFCCCGRLWASWFGAEGDVMPVGVVVADACGSSGCNRCLRVAEASQAASRVLADLSRPNFRSQPRKKLTMLCASTPVPVLCALQVMGDDMVKVVAWYDNEWGYRWDPC
jgi:hypothetical protein